MDKKRYEVTMKKASELYEKGLVEDIWYKGICAALDFGGAYWHERDNCYRLYMTGRPENEGDMSDIRGRVTGVQGHEMVEIQFQDAESEKKAWQQKHRLIQKEIAKLEK